MPRIRNDPNFNICLDYASINFANTRAQLINENVDEEQAIQLLRNIWQANNETDKVLWQQQLAEDREQREHAQRIQEDEQERVKQERIDEEDAARKEERKKNKHKYIPILDTGIPDEPSVTPCSMTDAMVLSTLADGSTAWISSASARNAKSVINDENLPFEEFCQACPRFLVALEEANWPEDRIRMMALFWRNIQVHKYRSLRDPIAQKTLLVYQAEQRRRWHVAAKSSTGPYNISTVNEKVLADTREKVYWEERLKRDNARDYKVSL
ncbi:uncharacterized protein EDB93DRAFT_1098877 [Suillus bovinus]|uniref:uncharacterized protein n=1 Tax=Suillus bovinus TaxID=48563 RepID=UPI001B876CA8|nr:uncharacterized protein EDB93DRAFT_1098877 [Suillus bovinus]KAG2123779.1 hypothetical protein EDB93DRAFT_1098877 [Suillus bovinus]